MILHTRSLSVNCPVCIGVELRLERKTLTCRGECVLGNVEPHTKSGGLQTISNITENDNLVRSVKENVVRPACKGSIGIIKSPCKSTITISYLTAVSGGGNKRSTAQIFIKLASKRIGTNKCIIYTVVLRPLLCFLKAHESGLIAILKVPDNLRTLTELDGIYKLDARIFNCYVNAGNRSIVGSGKVKSIKDTSVFIRKRYGNCISIYINICFSSHCNDGKLNCTNLIYGRIRNYGRGCRKLKCLGIGNCNGLRTNYNTTGDNLYINSTLLSVGKELTVNDCTILIVGECPRSISGHIHSITMSINCICGECILSEGSENVIIRVDVCYIKNACGSNVRSNEDTVSGRTLCAVTRNRAHLKVLFTNTLRNEGRRSTTVTVSSPLTAESEHCLAFLIIAETYGVVCATAVIHTDNECTVFLNADHRTCCRRGCSLLCLLNKFSIINNHAEGYTNSVKKSSGLEVSIEIISIERLNVTRNSAILFLEYVKNRAGGGSLSLNTDVFTVVYKYARRICIVVKVGVHTANDVVSKIILVILSHLGKFLMRPVSLIGGVLSKLINLVVSGNNGYVRVGRIDLNNVKNLSTSTRIIIKYDLGLNSRTGNKHIILLRDYVVITVGTKFGAFVNNVGVFPTCG